MSEFYSVNFSASAQTAAIDFFELSAASSKVCVLHEVRLGQTTDLGDAAEEVLMIKFVRGVGSVTSGNGSAATIVKLETGSSAASSTCETIATTQLAAGTGTLTTLKIIPWNIRSDFQYLPTPETRITLAPSEKLAIGLVAAPADSITYSGNLIFEEIG